MNLIEIKSSAIERLYEPLMRIGCLGKTPDAGYLRASWSKEETEAIDAVAAEALRIGLTRRDDAVGNVYLEKAGSSPGFIEAASHLDTVVLGGNYDGAAGVVAGLAAISAVLEQHPAPARGLRLRIWRGEESATYNTLCKGSQAAFGQLPPQALERSFETRTLREAIAAAGFDPTVIERGERTITSEEIDAIAAHFELHIEQANSLEQQQLDIGIVSSIRGPYRLRVELEGSFDHSGGTPMGPPYRRDANLALGYILVSIDRLADEAISEGYDLVQTAGIINSDRGANEHEPRVYQNAVAKVSGYCYFTLDIRSNDAAFRAAYIEKLRTTILQTAEAFSVNASISLISDTAPLPALDEPLRRLLLQSAEALRYPCCEMPSGAVHDATFVGLQTKQDGSPIPVAMLFIPCRDGKSHTPEEFTTFEAIAKGASVLATAISELARG